MGSGNDEGLNFDDLFFLMYYQHPQCTPVLLCVSLCLVLSSPTAHRFSLHVLVDGSPITLIHAFQLCIPQDKNPFFLSTLDEQSPREEFGMTQRGAWD